MSLNKGSFILGIQWFVGNGETLGFGVDPWLPLRVILQGLVKDIEGRG